MADVTFARSFPCHGGDLGVSAVKMRWDAFFSKVAIKMYVHMYMYNYM